MLPFETLLKWFNNLIACYDLKEKITIQELYFYYFSQIVKDDLITELKFLSNAGRKSNCSKSWMIINLIQ